MGRGRKIGIFLLVVFVLLFGLVVVADRIGASVAEDKIAEQAASEMQKAGATSARPPTAEIGGFPFLTQVAGGSYDRITIRADKPQTGDIKLETMTLVATDVQADAGDLLNGRGPVTARELSGTATMSWATVQSLIQLSGLPVPFDPKQMKVNVVDDKVELRLPVTFAGITTTLRASGTVSVADGRVQLRLTDVGTEGTELTPVARAALNQFRSRLTATIRTPQMPYKLVINKVETNSSGVLVTATAADVQLVT